MHSNQCVTLFYLNTAYQFISSPHTQIKRNSFVCVYTVLLHGYRQVVVAYTSTSWLSQIKVESVSQPLFHKKVAYSIVSHRNLNLKPFSSFDFSASKFWNALYFFQN